MPQLTKQEIFRIKDLSRQFRNKMLDKIDLAENCFTVCYPLSIHLHNNGIKNSIRGGFYKDREPHYLLSLNDYDCFVDPTIKQFEPDEDDVFVGNNSSKRYGFSTDELEQMIICEARNQWKEKLLNNGNTKQELSSLLRINLTAAAHIISETEQLAIRTNFIHSLNYNAYYNDVLEIIKVNLTENVEIIHGLLPTLPDGFAAVLANVKDLEECD